MPWIPFFCKPNATWQVALLSPALFSEPSAHSGYVTAAEPCGRERRGKLFSLLYILSMGVTGSRIQACPRG